MLKRFALILLCLFAGSPWAVAQESGVGEAVSRVGKYLKLTPDPVEPAPFVKESRPGKVDYLPVHTDRPPPRSAPLTPEQIKAKEAELNGVLASHDKIAGRAPNKVAYKPLNQDPKPKRVSRPKCVGYCLARGAILPPR